MANEDKKIQRSNWASRFNIVGEPRINDYTFKIDEQSQSSSWTYNQMNLGIYAGEKYGVCYVGRMGGFSPERTNKIYAHGKDDNGRDDFSKRIEIDWEDRDDESILENVGDQCFIRVGIERTTKGNIFTKKFLSAYDAILYIKENLTEDMVISVSGNLRYSMYNDKATMNKDITSIFLSNVSDPSGYHATFTQSILIDKDSANLKNVDKNTGIMPIDAIVLDYMKEFNGHEIRGQFPYHIQMEYQFDMTKPDLCKKIYNKLFNVKKGYTQITFDGDFISGGGVVTPTIDDIPDDIKELIDMGVYTEAEALEQCAVNAGREQHMFLKKPSIFMVGNDENKTATLQMFTEQYDEDELDMSWVYVQDNEDEDDDDLPFGNNESEEDGSTGDSDDDWLNMLD